jgi:crotonobetainyl-CoA:carnitine CoA-transferase CaiB-like acyl-CoA transferase
VPPPGGAFGDVLGGLTIAGGISAALFHRERTGEARVVDCSLLGMGVWATGFTLAACAAFGMERLAVGAGDRKQNANPLVGNYKTSDGRFLALVMMQADRFWPELVTVMGHPELVDDPRFADSASRADNRVECHETLDAIFATKPFEEWKAILADVKGVWSPVQTPGEILTDPQVVANGYVQEVTGSDGSTFQLVAAPVQFDGEQSTLTRGPDHGEHTDEVLQDLGYDMDRILQLKVDGTIL